MASTPRSPRCRAAVSGCSYIASPKSGRSPFTAESRNIGINATVSPSAKYSSSAIRQILNGRTARDAIASPRSWPKCVYSKAQHEQQGRKHQHEGAAPPMCRGVICDGTPARPPSHQHPPRAHRQLHSHRHKFLLFYINFLHNFAGRESHIGNEPIADAGYRLDEPRPVRIITMALRISSMQWVRVPSVTTTPAHSVVSNSSFVTRRPCRCTRTRGLKRFGRRPTSWPEHFSVCSPMSSANSHNGTCFHACFLPRYHCFFTEISEFCQGFPALVQLLDRVLARTIMTHIIKEVWLIKGHRTPQDATGWLRDFLRRLPERSRTHFRGCRRSPGESRFPGVVRAAGRLEGSESIFRPETLVCLDCLYKCRVPQLGSGA